MGKITKVGLLLLMLILTVYSATSVTVSGGSSSYTFTIENCTAAPNTTLGCSAQNIVFACTINNPAFIDFVQFRIQGSDLLTTQNSSDPDHFYINYPKALDTSSTTSPITMDRQTITDVASNSVNAFQVVSVPRSCEVCNANYNLTQLTSCSVNNTYILQHSSSNESCAPSFNTTESCNYCTPNIIANATACTTNGTRTVTYQDLNYSTCCLQTGLSEDCIINTPAYAPQNQTCNFYTNQFSCTLDQAPVLNDKININCELPSDEETCCVVNVYQGAGLSDLLQSNPEYKSTSNFFLMPKDQETRTCFTPQQRLLNAYYTEKEVRSETRYKVQVKCTNSNTTLISEYEVVPSYHTPDEWLLRFNWVANNPVHILGTIFVIVLFAAVILYAIHKVKHK